MVIKGCKGTPALFRATSYEVFHVEVQLIAQVRMRLFFFNNHIRKIGKWRGSVSQFQVRVLRKDPARKRKLEKWRGPVTSSLVWLQERGPGQKEEIKK